jgi:hypothetical protein
MWSERFYSFPSTAPSICAAFVTSRVRGVTRRSEWAKGSRTGIHPLRALPQGFLNERPPDTAIGSGYENCSICDLHFFIALTGGVWAGGASKLFSCGKHQTSLMLQSLASISSNSLLIEALSVRPRPWIMYPWWP